MDIRRELGNAETPEILQLVLEGVDLRASGEIESNATTRHRGASHPASNFKVQEPDLTVETVGNSTVSSV